MSFKRIACISEGNYIVEITDVNLINFKGDKEALKLTLETYEDNPLSGSFLIFINNTYLIDKLINSVCENTSVYEVNEKEFIGGFIEITTKVKGGYLNIVDINPVEFEDDE